MNPKELYKLLTKHHLVRETEYTMDEGELYVFHPIDKVYQGAPVVYGLSGMPMVSFAKAVKFSAENGIPYVVCLGWEKPIVEEEYENKLVSLEKQYNKSVNDYKKFLVKQRLNKMKGDFK